MVKPVPEGEVLPHPAEDLSSDDDLLSWILVDQLGCLPNTKLGVHPQQVKFVGPPFKTSEVLSIVQETVVNTKMPEAMRRFLDFHLIKAHCDAKQTPKQKERFVQHLRRYLLPLLPTSRIEIYTTNRYTAVTGHTELAVYATRPLSQGDVLQELQGSVVPLPDAWRAEMDLGDEFALEAAGQEGDSEEDEGDDEDENSSRNRDGRTAEDGLDEGGDGPSKRGGRRKREARGARRSDRTKRRDFSIVWSGLKRCYQLFLGPARFLNHDCNPNVELLRQGQYVTFRATRPIRIGDEVMTFYGDNYFGKDNVECLCLSCEQAGRNGFAPKASTSNTRSRSRSQSMSSSMRDRSPSRRAPRPSTLKKALNGLRDGSPSAATEIDAGPSGTQADEDDPVTPRKTRSRPNGLSAGVNGIDSPSTESVRSEPDTPGDDEPPKRERYHRRAARNAQHFSFLKRPKKQVLPEPLGDALVDEEDEDCVRCVTCAKAMHERIWYNNKYFDHCARCVRHALIFDLPWPAHQSSDVLDYPPSHLIPAGYIPPRVSSIALPSLDKHRKKHVEPAPVPPQGETHAERRARKFRQECAMEDLRIEQLREAMWTTQDTAERQAQAAAQAKIDAKVKRLEQKKLKDHGRIKGSGVWSRYEYIDEAELERRKQARMAVTTGTRRGGRFKPPDSDEEDQAEDKVEESGVPSVGEAGPSRSRPATPPPSVLLASIDDGILPADDDRLPSAGPSRQRTPENGVEPKIEPGSSSRSQRVRDMPHIDISSDREDYDSDEIVCIGTQADVSTDLFIARAARLTAKQRGELSDDDSDLVELDLSPSKRTNGLSKPTAASGKLPTTSVIAKSASGLAKGKERAIETNTDGPERSESPTKRGRGRPPGTGKKQRAAVNNAARARPVAAEAPMSSTKPQAGPSRPQKRKMLKSKAVVDSDDESPETDRAIAPQSASHTKSQSQPSRPEPHFLLGIEDKIKELSKPVQLYTWMIESIDNDGSVGWKELSDRPSKTMFPPEHVLLSFMAMEHGEFLRRLKCSHDGDRSSTSPSQRPLPGQRVLVNQAELARWQPSRLKPQAAERTQTTELRKPYKVVGGLEVVGYTVDIYACGKDGPRKTVGPWKNGHYRMVAARPVTDKFSCLPAISKEVMVTKAQLVAGSSTSSTAAAETEKTKEKARVSTPRTSLAMRTPIPKHNAASSSRTVPEPSARESSQQARTSKAATPRKSGLSSSKSHDASKSGPTAKLPIAQPPILSFSRAPSKSHDASKSGSTAKLPIAQPPILSFSRGPSKSHDASKSGSTAKLPIAQPPILSFSRAPSKSHDATKSGSTAKLPIAQPPTSSSSRAQMAAQVVAPPSKTSPPRDLGAASSESTLASSGEATDKRPSAQTPEVYTWERLGPPIETPPNELYTWERFDGPLETPSSKMSSPRQPGASTSKSSSSIIKDSARKPPRTQSPVASSSRVQTIAHGATTHPSRVSSSGEADGSSNKSSNTPINGSGGPNIGATRQYILGTVDRDSTRPSKMPKLGESDPMSGKSSDTMAGARKATVSRAQPIAPETLETARREIDRKSKHRLALAMEPPAPSKASEVSPRVDNAASVVPPPMAAGPRSSVKETSNATPTTSTAGKVMTTNSPAASSTPGPQSNGTDSSTNKFGVLVDRYRPGGSSLAKASAPTASTTTVQANGVFTNGHTNSTTKVDGKAPAVAPVIAHRSHWSPSRGSLSKASVSVTPAADAMTTAQPSTAPRAAVSTPSTTSTRSSTNSSFHVDTYRGGVSSDRSTVETPKSTNSSIQHPPNNKRKAEFSLSPAPKRRLPWLDAQV